jgi:hypothetical protein
LRECNQKKE